MKCPLCDSNMLERTGKHGSFYGCSRYPECKGTVNAPPPGAGQLPEENITALLAIGEHCKISVKRYDPAQCTMDCKLFPFKDGIDREKLSDQHQD